MQHVNFELLNSRKEQLHRLFNDAVPFRYIVIDNFLHTAIAEKALAVYPDPKEEGWNGTTYINQKKKFQLADFRSLPFISSLFEELNGNVMIDFLQNLTGMTGLTADAGLFGAGLHQSINGAFLDVHVDFNVHPVSKLYRRLNLLIFLNKEWKAEYGGELELWDMEKKACFAKISPDFNRCVIFETNNVSYHGHPVPLNVPEKITRKSLAVYYYTKDAPPEVKVGGEHNSIFVSTQGMKGRIKNFFSGVVALKERIQKKLK